MATFKGNTVKAGVKWIVDKDTITITSYPSKTSDKGKKVPYKIQTRTWKNKCPFKTCGAVGQLDGHGDNRKIGKWGKEGQVYCKKCTADFCGVTGLDLHVKPLARLQTALAPTRASTSSKTAVKLKTSQHDKKKALRDIKTKYKERSTPKKDNKIIIPPLKDVAEGNYIELVPPLVDKPQIFFIGDYDTAEFDMKLILYEKVPQPGNPYQEPNKITNNNIHVSIPSNTNNITSTAVSGAKTAIEKTLRLKGAELKTFTNIWNWIKSGGRGGYSWIKYYDWYPSGGTYKTFNPSAFNNRWNNGRGGRANCTWFAWAFHYMCKGIGIHVDICRSPGHVYNVYKGSVWDASFPKARLSAKWYSNRSHAV